MPVFQGHSGGIDYFFGVTGGYLIGFIFASVVISVLSNTGFKKRPFHMGNDYWKYLHIYSRSNLVINL